MEHGVEIYNTVALSNVHFSPYKSLPGKPIVEVQLQLQGGPYQTLDYFEHVTSWILVCGLPFSIVVMIFKIKDLPFKSVEDKLQEHLEYGELLKGLSLESGLVPHYWSILILLRWIITLIIMVLLRDYFAIQIMVLLFLSILYLILIIVGKPYIRP